MYMSNGFSQRINKLENDLTSIILLEQQLNQKNLCAFHRHQLEKRIQDNDPYCENISSAVKSCPNCEQNEHLHHVHRHKKKPSRQQCSCNKDLKRQFSSPTPSFYHEGCKPPGAIEPSMIQHIESIENKTIRGKEKFEHLSRKSYSSDSSTRAVNRAASCPVKKSSRSRSRSVCSSCKTKHAESYICNTDDIQDLKAEVSKIRRQIEDMNNTKEEALEVTNILKAKYDKLGYQKNALQEQLKKLKTENKFLTTELERRIKMQDAFMEELQDSKNMLNVYKEQACTFHDQSVKNSKTISETKEKFCKCLEAKDNHIKELKTKKVKLEKELKDKDCACSEMSDKCQSMEAQVQENRAKLQQLSESNSKLCKCIKTLEDQLDDAVKEGYRAKGNVADSSQELENLKRQYHEKCKCEDKLRKEKEVLSHKLNECGCLEEELTNRISKLTKRIATIEKETAAQMACGDHCKKLKTENEKLAQQCEDLRKRLKNFETNDQANCLTMKRKLDECTRAMTEKEKIITKERDELRNLVEELTNVVKQNKVTLLHLSTINKKQESLIRTQEDQLMEKEDKLRHAEIDTEKMKQRTKELEQQVNALKRAMDKFENATYPVPVCPAKLKSMDTLKQEFENMRVALQAERETTQIKQQIIDDQAKTLCHLKCKLKEKIRELTEVQDELLNTTDQIRILRQELRRAQHEVDIQTREKEGLIADLQQIEQQKDNLTGKVNELERLVKQYCDNENCSMKQKQFACAIEKKWQIERKELETEREILMKERNNALYAARFATQKLMETVTDFQNQVDTHKQVQQTLTCLLQQKEAKLRAVASKMSSITAIAQTAQVEEKEKPCPITTELYRRPYTASKPSKCHGSSGTCRGSTSSRLCSSRRKIHVDSSYDDWD